MDGNSYMFGIRFTVLFLKFRLKIMKFGLNPLFLPLTKCQMSKIDTEYITQMKMH